MSEKEKVVCSFCGISNAERADDGKMKRHKTYLCNSCGKLFSVRKPPPEPKFPKDDVFKEGEVEPE